MARIASFHLIRERPWRAPLAMMRLGTDRLSLRGVSGLSFWRLMGTGAGDDTGPGIDPRRTALFAVWDDESDLDRFLAGHYIARRWSSAEESFHVRLRLISGHGSWRGVEVIDGLEPGGADGPVAVVTRADVRRRSWREFGRAGREVDSELHTADGLIDVVGIGEAPVGRLATFSLWESNDAVNRYAFESPRHLEVMEQTRAGDWYSEELFARFEPYDATGTWSGRAPLADRPR
jgi:heme-degrading monooxygenase HmoA